MKGLILYLAICFSGLLESIYGVLQVFGVLPSRNAFFKLTGHFDNPGPYGGFLAVVAAIVIGYLLMNSHKESSIIDCAVLWISRLCLFACLIVLPATMSRAAWIALSIAVLIVSLSYPESRGWLAKHRSVLICSISAICLLLPMAFFLKKDSAIGRLHIWRIDWLTIMDSPWKGHGRQYVMGAYGNCQERFFRSHLDSVSPDIIRVAGCPEYPFNEYLGVGMAYGIPVMILVVAITIFVIVRLIKSQSHYAGGAIALGLFASASYPMACFGFWILLAIMMSALIPGKSCPSGVLLGVIVLILGVFNMKSGDRQRISKCEEIFDRGYDLHLNSHYKESTAVLFSGAMLSPDPMFHIIIGKNHEALEDFTSALEEYETAHFMVPYRIYPLERLMRLKLKQHDNDSALMYAEQVEDMPINENHKGMAYLKKVCCSVVDSLRLKQTSL